jgi:hypothetical protein
MALHFTLVGESELSVHFDIDGLCELLKAIEGTIRASKDHVASGVPDVIPLTVGRDSPAALAKVTLTFLNPPPPPAIH